LRLFQQVKDAGIPLTSEQTAFIQAVAALQPGQAAGLEAKAGTGKTYTMLRAMGRLPRGSRMLLLAFNKKVEKELSKKAPVGVDVRTFHGFCQSRLKKRMSDQEVVFNKTYKLLKERVKNRRARWPISQTISLAKNLGVGVMLPDEIEIWKELLTEYDIRLPKSVSSDYVIGYARKLLAELSADPVQVDFDDMLYYVARDGLGDMVPYDYVLVDEAQDTNPIQLAVLDHLMSNGHTALVFVGDPKQAIYGWRGAGVQAFQEMADRYGANTYSLTTTWRCPRSVVELAQQIVPEIQPREDAPEGEVQRIHPEDFQDLGPTLGNRDVVLCRNNAPLLSMALRFVAAGHPCKILGKDITGRVMKTIQYAYKGGGVASDAPLVRMAHKATQDLEDRPFALAAALEEVACATVVYNYVMEQEYDIRSHTDLVLAVEKVCKDLFSEDEKKDCLTFTTIHRAKGLEWEHVWWLDPKNVPSKSAKKAGGWHLGQEYNLAYVAITRAKEALTLVSSVDKPLEHLTGG